MYKYAPRCHAVMYHSRRVRLLTAGIHASLFQIHTIRDQILLFFHETASPSQLETILGTWCIAAHDIDRSVASTALNSWVSSVSSKTDGNEGPQLPSVKLSTGSQFRKSLNCHPHQSDFRLFSYCSCWC